MPLPLPSQTYSTQDQAQTRAQISQQLTALKAQISGLQTAVAAYPVWDLRYYAAEAGITLGQGNDQPAFDAAHAAMAAKAANVMLYVEVPPGLYMVDQVKIYSSAGFWCAPGAAMLRQKPQATPQPIVVFGVLDDTEDEGSTAASWLLWGFKIDGQFYPDYFAGGGLDETTPGLFHYQASDYSGGDPERPYNATTCPNGAIIGQAGVYLRGAFGDAAYGVSGGNTNTIAENSPFSSTGAQNRADGDARFRCGELDICCVAGDGFNLQGTGAGVLGPIRVYNAAGRGIVLNAYDNKITTLEAGGCGLEGFVCHSQFSDTDIGHSKFWFTGLRVNAGNTGLGGLAQDAGHTYGVWMDTPAFVTASIQVQDSVGSPFRIDGQKECHLDLHADYAGLPAAYQTGPSGIEFNLGAYGLNACQGGFIKFSINPAPVEGVGPYPNLKSVFTANAKLMSTVIMVNQTNMPTANPGNAGTDFVDPGWLAVGDLTLIAYPASMPVSGETLILNGSTVTFTAAPADVAALAADINAASLPGVTASTLGSALTLTSTTGTPASLTMAGTALTALNLDAGTVTSNSYYDTALILFGTTVRAPRAWMANSNGYINFGLGYAGVTATSAGVGSLTAAGRQTPVSLGVVDTTFSPPQFRYPVYAKLDASGNQQISFLGQYPPAPVQTFSGGPLPDTATIPQIVAQLNFLFAALNSFGLTNYTS